MELHDDVVSGPLSAGLKMVTQENPGDCLRRKFAYRIPGVGPSEVHQGAEWNRHAVEILVESFVVRAVPFG
jgi:hypothetical protein